MPPVILLAFANDRSGRFLRSIAEEQRRITQALAPLVDQKLLRVEVLSNATAADIFAAFRRYRDRIRVFHYGGHAQELDLLLSGAAVCGTVLPSPGQRARGDAEFRRGRRDHHRAVGQRSYDLFLTRRPADR